MSHAEVEITGEFREDGSCEVGAAGRSLYTAADNARTTYVAGSNILVCEPADVAAAGRRMFMVTFAPAKPVRQAGRFTIVVNSSQDGPFAINGSYFDPSRYWAGKPGGGFGIGGVEYLTMTSGSIEFTRLDSTAVSRPFRLTSVREWGNSH